MQYHEAFTPAIPGWSPWHSPSPSSTSTNAGGACFCSDVSVPSQKCPRCPPNPNRPAGCATRRRCQALMGRETSERGGYRSWSEARIQHRMRSRVGTDPTGSCLALEL
ncbi:hypothetical protein AAFF_G00211280 [Aldrovandia affinis]|uniref:Uncharacterized protein n=1 Tax=Aldrovandia affinis TaxID=143900 RepID=A0AAD7SWH4_9TELE|nr:hypothetical protein AAFF_G00211280 [Aldrovandia affinis]